MLIYLVLWLVLFLFSMLIEASHIFNFVVVVFWCFTCAQFIKKNSSFGSMSLIFFWSFTITGITLFFCEFGTYYPESQLATFLTGATARNLILCFFILYAAYFSFSVLERKVTLSGGIPDALNYFIKRFVILYSVTALIVLLGIFIVYGTPNQYQVDRFYYWENIAPSWGKYIQFLLIQFSLFIGLFYAQSKSKLYLAIIFFSIMTQVFTGEKFTGPFLSLVMFFIPVIVLDNKNLFGIIFKLKSLVLLITFCIVFYIIILSSYESIRGAENGTIFLFSRIALQSQMWWAIDNFSNLYESATLPSILTHFIGFADSDADTGMYYLMKVITPSATFNRFYEQNITFTMASPTNLIYFFSYPFAVIIALLLGTITGSIFWVVKNAIVLNDLVMIFLSLKLYYLIIRVLTMGEVFLLFNWKFLVYTLVIFTYVIISNKFTRDK